MDIKADSGDLLVLVYTLGIVAVGINLFAYYKKTNEYNGLLLDDQGALVLITKWLNSDMGKAAIQDFINIDSAGRLQYFMYDGNYMILNEDRTKILQTDMTMGTEDQFWTFSKATTPNS